MRHAATGAGLFAGRAAVRGPRMHTSSWSFAVSAVGRRAGIWSDGRLQVRQLRRQRKRLQQPVGDGELTPTNLLAVFTGRHLEVGPLTCRTCSSGASSVIPPRCIMPSTSYCTPFRRSSWFSVFWRMTGRLWPTRLLAAAVFAVHPLHVESVAWVTERKDVLSGLFFLLTLAAYFGYVRRPFSLGRYVLVLVCFAVGLAAKPTAVTLPFLLLLLDYWPLRRLWLGNNEEKQATTMCLRLGFSPEIPFVLHPSPQRVWSSRSFPCGCCGGFLRREHPRSRSRPRHQSVLSVWWRVGNATISYAVYLVQSFLPRLGLAPAYPRWPLPLPSWDIGIATLVLV